MEKSLEKEHFRESLKNVDVFVASHHVEKMVIAAMSSTTVLLK